jgi:UDP-GlcNAc:undecaprenyl-phosphate GlcNAc-1-phosphate transferase
LGLVDVPDGRRKMQSHPIPTGGGLAVFLAAVSSLMVAQTAIPELAEFLAANAVQAITLLVSSGLIVVVGLLDDRFNLRARYKLIGQLTAILILVLAGNFQIERICLFGWTVEFGPMAALATTFWLLTCVNALNLIDGMDGLAGMVGLIALLTFAMIAGMAGHIFPSAVALALAGAIAGFLWFNLPPASVYMGDAGSMLIGLIVGAVAIPASFKGPATVALITPVAILILPMTDTAAAVIRRKLTGRTLATTDRGHLHHVLQRHGLTARKVLIVVSGFGLAAAAGAFASTLMNNDIYALIVAGGVVCTLVGTRLFGHAEFRLIIERSRASLRGVLSKATHRELSIHFQGTADWDGMWDSLLACARQTNLHSIYLDVNAPAMQENYHARWDRASRDSESANFWRFELPLFNRRQPIGRLVVMGGSSDEPIMARLSTLASIIDLAERQTIQVNRFSSSPSPVANESRGDYEVRTGAERPTLAESIA